MPTGMVEPGNGFKRARQRQPFFGGFNEFIAVTVNGAVAVEDDEFHESQSMGSGGQRLLPASHKQAAKATRNQAQHQRIARFKQCGLRIIN